MSDAKTAQPPVVPQPKPGPGASRWEAWLPTVKETIAAVVLALLVGAVLIIFSTPRVIESLSYFFSYPWDFFRYAGLAVWDGYSALLNGSIGSPGALVRTLERAAPLICAGLGVSLAFRAGMFNIGAQGQMLAGGIMCGWIGFQLDLPVFLHLLVALLGAVVVAGLWGGIAGFLKARTGAHEVITTIMLNYVGLFLLLYFLAKESFQRPGAENLLSPAVADSASFPSILGLHTGFFLAVIAALVIWWLLERSTWGFEIRAVGANPDAARTAGMSVGRVYITAMTVAGMLAGLAVAMQLLGRAGPLERSDRGQHRLRRHHRRAARPRHAARYRARRLAVRRAVVGRSGDAGRGRRTAGDVSGAAGADRALRGRARADPGSVPHPRR